MTPTDTAYLERNKLVVLLAHIIINSGRKAGRGYDTEAEEGWQNVILIDLPTGQISFHVADRDMEASGADQLPIYSGDWDGHTSVEKWERLDKYVMSYAFVQGRR